MVHCPKCNEVIGEKKSICPLCHHVFTDQELTDIHLTESFKPKYI